MNLLELIPHIKTLKDAQQFISHEVPHIEYDSIEVFMKDKVSMESEIHFFDSEHIPGTIIMEVDGKTYEAFLPFYMLQEFIEEYIEYKGNSLTDIEIANRVMDYWRNDA